MNLPELLELELLCDDELLDEECEEEDDEEEEEEELEDDEEDRLRLLARFRFSLPVNIFVSRIISAHLSPITDQGQ